MKLIGPGAKIRTLRRQRRLTQTALGRLVGVSPSYINLLEHNRRTLSVELLVKLAEVLPIDLKELSVNQQGRTVSELLEVFGDPMFENQDVIAQDVTELAAAYPQVASAVIQLYDGFRSARKSAQDLGEAVSQGAAFHDVHQSRFPSEEVADLIQTYMNYFPQLEHAAEVLNRSANLEQHSLFEGLVHYLKNTVDVDVRIEPRERMQSAVRSYDPTRKILFLSDALRRGRRNFAVAYQIGLLTQSAILDQITADPVLTSPESRATGRIALANYFAAAVLMPYEAFLAAARKERYDIELLGHQFEASFEQTCHRLASLRRPGAEGIP